MQSFLKKLFAREHLKYENAYFNTMMQTDRGIKIGGRHFTGDVITLDVGTGLVELEVDALRAATVLYQRFSKSGGIGFTPQLAAVLYDVSGVLPYMSTYFMRAMQSSPDERTAFFDVVREIMAHSNFQLIVFGFDGKKNSDKTPHSIRALVAGHIAEILYQRPDVLEQFFKHPKTVNIYMSASGYQASGGVAGGCYDPQTHSIKLVASRLYEGFYGRVPGVAPFIHEFGHLLDYFHVVSGQQRSATGLFPGMHPTDFNFFSPEARELFVAGKNLELERYNAVRGQYEGWRDTLPIGSPYVFQNDGEFLAGYLEMFFRNPHAFYQMNPTLYQAFQETFKQDPRTYWAYDFDGYMLENKAAYHQWQQVPKAGLTVLS